MNKLIELLKALEASDEIAPTTWLGQEDNPHPIFDLIDTELCGELINSDGSCNFRNHAILKQAGFNVFAGEKDSFGWLTGCVSTKKGTIVYG